MVSWGTVVFISLYNVLKFGCLKAQHTQTLILKSDYPGGMYGTYLAVNNYHSASKGKS